MSRQDIWRSVGQRIAAIRMDKGFTQMLFANLIGMTDPQLSAIEAGKRINLNTLLRITDALGVTLAEFFDDDAFRTLGDPAAVLPAPRGDGRDDAVLEVFRANPDATIALVAERRGLSVDMVKRCVRRLKEAGRLRRVGGARVGRWEVARDDGASTGDDA